MANIILCVGSVEDPHIIPVKQHIQTLDSEARVVLFNPLCGSHFIELNTETSNNQRDMSCTLTVDGERFPAQCIRSVWYRWKPATLSADNDLQTLIAKDFILNEWKSVIRSLESFLSHARWLNPIGPLDRIRSKPHQLWLAQQIGLTIPTTTITNNPAAVERIFDEAQHGRVIFKSLTPLYLPPDKMLYTTEITREFPLQSHSNVVKCPAIYQELVQRQSDLRITVVGREVFVVRISSQKLEREKDRLDWRRCQDVDELYDKAEISESFKRRLLEFHERAGLVFAAYDFLERGEEVIFLECNPAGAWLWLEERLGLNVSECVARYLLGKQGTALENIDPGSESG